MKSRLRKCITCDKYTLKEVCTTCNTSTISPIPARFSPSDKYGRYRRLLRYLKNA